MAIPASPSRSADAAATGSLFIVGGHSRNVGKTGVIEQLLMEHHAEAWAAVKISAHRHAPEGAVAPVIEEHTEADPQTQTGRYLLAGARHAFLVRAPDGAMARAAAFVESLRANGWNVMVESNRIVTHVVATLVVFVIDPRNADWKPSSDACLAAADLVVYRDGAPVCVPARVERRSAGAWRKS